MYFEQGISVKKAAQILGLPYSTAKYLVRVHKSKFPSAKFGETSVTENDITRSKSLTCSV
jgi:hypothetical protein